MQKFTERYYTVDQIKENKQEEPKINTEEAQQRTKLVNIINEIVKIFGKIDFNVDYKNENGEIVALLYLAPPLSTNDIKGLEELSANHNFRYNAISDKNKINIKNRNSLIEIFLIDEQTKEGVRDE